MKGREELTYPELYIILELNKMGNNINLSNLNLYCRDIRDNEIKNMVIENTSFKESAFINVDLINLHFINCDFSNKYMWKNMLSNVKFTNCTFDNTKIADCNLKKVKFVSCSFIESKFIKNEFSNSCFTVCKGSYTKLIKNVFTKCKIVHSFFEDYSNVQNCTFIDSKIYDTEIADGVMDSDFRKTEIVSSRNVGVRYIDNSITECLLSDLDFEIANLGGTKIENSILIDVSFKDTLMFGTKLKNNSFLKNVNFEGTIYERIFRNETLKCREE